MSFVGQIAFNNYPSERIGAPSNAAQAFNRRSIVNEDDPEAAQHVQNKRDSWARLTGRRRSSVGQSPSQRNSVYVPTELPADAVLDVHDEQKEHMEDRETPNPSKFFEDSDEDLSSKDDATIGRLARQITQHSTWSQVPNNPFQAEPDSVLDPHSEHFRARTWTKSMIKLTREDGKNKPRTGGVAFRNLSAYGFGQGTDYQKDVANVWLDVLGVAKSLLGLGKPRRIDILRNMDGVVESGEMLVVLGPPGSGCSTFLKALTGETHGFNVEHDSYLNYQGVPAKHMHKYFRGEAIYTAEVDVHFPQLSVGDTLYFAARARAPRNIPGGASPHEFAVLTRDVIMATFGIGHTINTRVGNDFVRGVSGGERKRVSIAEAMLSGAPIQAWDNSTRGLDSANAIEFCKTVKMSAELSGSTAFVAIYQAPQSAYDLFDKVVVLYQGRQIYFGRTGDARAYFEEMGFKCPDRQTTADFLTSMTSPQERIVREGWEDKVPRTSDEFAERWQNSLERKALLGDIEAYDKRYPLEGEAYKQFVESRRTQQAKQQRLKSPYTLSYLQQVKLCLWRGFRRLVGDPEFAATGFISNFIIALILGSVWYNLGQNTQSFFSRGTVIFFSVLTNAFASALEILTLYAQRPIVEKHNRYALYHPSAEAFASMLCDIPYKVGNAIAFNLTLYFMVNLRREPGPFFFFLFVSFLITLVMSMIFRTIASASKTLPQALTPAAMLILAIVLFTGFVIPVDYMLGWCRWINYIDPVAYGFEALMDNEFHGRDYLCSAIVPNYGSLADYTQVCDAVGSEPGLDYVRGANYLAVSFQYYNAHKWRNVGIVIGFIIFFMFLYLAAAEFITSGKSKGEVLLFQRGHIPAQLKEKTRDEETGNVPAGRNNLEKVESYTGGTDVIQKQTAIFSWKDVCYDIKIKGNPRRILDHVDGWVKPGTLTALMGVSGAGKTTLLDVLATRVTTGVITGDMLVDGRQRDSSFQRKTGYVQQQDLHLATSTVREALNFSALLRQPKSTPRQEKLDYVDEVIKLLDMQEYADAVVGVPGEGLNVEQRKRLTIGVELAAKPALLLFLDEPTSGLDSQTSWAICDLMEKLKNSGQAILCTIHQPSAVLFQRFDRLLFLAKGGRTIYFGEIGQGSNVLTSYFERNGAHKCPADANPAEWMLEVIGAAPGTTTDKDWHEVWRSSPEYTGVQDHLQFLKEDRLAHTQAPSADTQNSEEYREFAAPFGEQMWQVLHRVLQQYWRNPSYIYAKTALCVFCALFIGFIFFKAPLTHQGLQNQMFSVFMIFTVFGQLSQQIMPNFVTQRSLYEVRERPSKAYSWQAFLMSNILVELPWNGLMAVLMYFCYYYPVGLYANAAETGQVHERGALFFLCFLSFMLFASTFTSMIIAGMNSAETGGNILNLLFILSLTFCGVLATPTALPGFWIWMYYVSPFTYLISAFLSAGLSDTAVHCADQELLTFNATGGNCGEYMTDYINTNGGYLISNTSTSCQYCTYDNSNTFLASVNIYSSHQWRNWALVWIYIFFNIGAAVFFYWLARVPKTPKKKKEE